MSGVYETSLMHRLFNYDHLLGRRPMSSKTGASGSYLSTPMDVLPLSRRRFYPSGYGDRVGELRVDPGANWPLNFPLPSFGKKREKNWSHGWKNGQRWRTILSKKVHETSNSARLLVTDSLLLPQRESKQRRLIPRKPINLLTSHEGRSQVAPYSQIRLIVTFFSAYFRKFPSLFNFHWIIFLLLVLWISR